ncbi:MAG: molybdopterin oxidoreductase family protein [Candidatus Brocadiales bacterium]
MPEKPTDSPEEQRRRLRRAFLKLGVYSIPIITTGVACSKDFAGLPPMKGSPTSQWTKSTCPYCGIGCGLMVGIENGKVVEVRGMKGHPVNNGEICHLAETLPQVFTASGRLTRQMIRRDGELIPVALNEAIMHVATQLGRIIEKHGSNAVAFYGGASILCEESYLINKLLKGCIGTNNIECSIRLGMVSSAAGFVSTFGMDAPPACYADIEEADLFFIAGNNMAVSLPILFKRVRAVKKKNNAKVIVVDPRHTETAKIADIHLRIWPGTDVALNNGLAHLLLKEGFVDEADVAYSASGLSELKGFLEKYPPSHVAKITGCPEEQIVNAARTIGRAKAMLTFWCQGYNQSTQAVFKNNTLHNLSLLTGNICRTGAGPLSITGGSNVLGNRWVGALSHLLPGIRHVTNPQHCKETIEVIEGLHSGDVRALWIVQTNPAASLPNTRWVEEGLAKAEFLVVQDIFHPTETTVQADVVLAAAQWSEKTGTFISSERRIELAEKLIDPPGDAKPDYELIWLVARAMGFNKEFPYTSPEEVFEELKGITRGRICDMGGVTYERLRGKVGPQLPCPDAEHPGTERLFTDRRFPRADGRGALLARTYIEPAETTDAEYPFVLITGRLSWHFNTRTRTGRIPKLNNLAPDNFAEVHPEDALSVGVTEGDEVRVESRRGSVLAKVRITDRVLASTVYMNMHYGSSLWVGDGRLANIVTNPVYDKHSKQPELKFCAVKIAKTATQRKT